MSLLNLVAKKHQPNQNRLEKPAAVKTVAKKHRSRKHRRKNRSEKAEAKDGYS